MRCVRCQRPMARGKRLDGHVLHKGRGLCASCWGVSRYRPTHKNKGRYSSDIDPVAVERAIEGCPVVLTSAERALAVQILAGRGLSAAAIAGRLGIQPRSVWRIRARLKEAA